MKMRKFFNINTKVGGGGGGGNFLHNNNNNGFI